MNPKLFYFGLLLVLAFHMTISAVNLIHQTCTKCVLNDPNISYNFCVTSLQAYPRSRRANLSKLGFISIKITRQNVTDTKQYIKGLLKNKKLDHDTRACLIDCLQLYSNAISTLKQAIKDYNSKHYQDANIEVSSVLDASTTCDDGFHEKGLVSPLESRNNNAFQLSAIALSIINMMNR